MNALTLPLHSAGWLPLLPELAVKVTLVLVLAGAASALLSRASSAARHLVWCVGLVGVLALPLLSLSVPAWELPVVPAAVPAGADTDVLAMRLGTMAHPLGGGEAEPMPSAAPDPEPTAAPVPRSGTPAPIGSVLLMVLLTGVVAGVVRVAFGMWGLARLGRCAGPARDPAWLAEMREAAGRLGLRRRVLLLRGDARMMPATWGIFRPVVILPASADGWTPERRRAVLAHELAHVKRFDCLTQTLAQVACALFWWHPGVWHAARRLRIERERACDDLVLLAGSRASEYAAHLLEIARSYRAPGLPAPLLLSMARSSQLESRLLSVLDPRRLRGAPSLPAAVLAMGAGLLVVGPLAAVRPVEAVAASGPGSVPAISAAAAEIASPARWSKAGDGEAEPRIVSPPEGEARGGGDAGAAGEVSEAPGGADTTRLPGAEAPRSAAEIEQLIAMRAVGVDARYIAAMSEAGFPGLPVDQLISMRALGVTPAYIEEVRRHGYGDLTADQVQSMRAMGVSGAYIQAMNAAAQRVIPAPELVSLRAVGVTVEYLRSLERLGFTGLTMDRVQHMRAVGVTASYVEQMRALGHSELDPEALVGLRAVGVTPDYVRELQTVGITGLSAARLTDLRAHNVTARWVRELEAAGIGPLSAEQLIRLRVSGADRELIRSRTRENLQ